MLTLQQIVQLILCANDAILFSQHTEPSELSVEFKNY
jgi:hypothetical protein